MMVNATLTILALLAVCSSCVPMYNRKEEYLRELADMVKPAKENGSSLKKRTYGSLSLGGSYGTSKRGDMSLLRLGSGFGRTSRGLERTDDIEVVPRKFEASYENYLRNKNIIPHLFMEPSNIDDLFEADKQVSDAYGRSSEYASKTFPAEEFNQAD